MPVDAPSRLRDSGGQFVRFVLAGIVNTAISYAVFFAASFALAYQLAWLVAYAAGILAAYQLNTRFVFRTSRSRVTAFAYPLVYAAQYAAGALVLHAAVEWLRIAPRLAALVALALTVPLSFVLNRLVLAGGSARKRDDR